MITCFAGEHDLLGKEIDERIKIFLPYLFGVFAHLPHPQIETKFKKH